MIISMFHENFSSESLASPSTTTTNKQSLLPPSLGKLNTASPAGSTTGIDQNDGSKSPIKVPRKPVRTGSSDSGASISSGSESIKQRPRASTVGSDATSQLPLFGNGADGPSSHTMHQLQGYHFHKSFKNSPHHQSHTSSHSHSPQAQHPSPHQPLHTPHSQNKKSAKQILRHAYRHSMHNPLFPTLPQEQNRLSHSPSPGVHVKIRDKAPPVLELDPLMVNPISADMAKAGFPVYSVPRKPVGSNSSFVSTHSNATSKLADTGISSSASSRTAVASSPAPSVHVPPENRTVDLARSSARARSKSPIKKEAVYNISPGTRSPNVGRECPNPGNDTSPNIGSDQSTKISFENSPSVGGPDFEYDTNASTSKRTGRNSPNFGPDNIPNEKSGLNLIQGRGSPNLTDRITNFSNRDKSYISRGDSPSHSVERPRLVPSPKFRDSSPAPRILNFRDDDTFTFLQTPDISIVRGSSDSQIKLEPTNPRSNSATQSSHGNVAAIDPHTTPNFLNQRKEYSPEKFHPDLGSHLVSPESSPELKDNLSPLKYTTPRRPLANTSSPPPTLSPHISPSEDQSRVTKTSQRPMSLQFADFPENSRKQMDPDYDDEFEFEEESDSHSANDAAHWKYHILKYSKDLYLTTNPDTQHLDMRVGPSYYVDISSYGNGKFKLDFNESSKLSFSVIRMRSDAINSDGYQVTIFSDTDQPKIFPVRDASEMLYSPNSSYTKSVKCEQYIFCDNENRQWLIGNRQHLTKGDIVKVSKTKVYFSLKSDPQVVLGMVRRRIPIKKRVLQLGKKDHDKEQDDDADEEKIGWLYVYDLALQDSYPPWMMKVVVGLTMAVAYGQRLDTKRSFRASLNLDKLQGVGRVPK